MNIHGIPKTLLNDGATLLKAISYNVYGVEEFQATTLNNIRFEKANSLIKNGDEIIEKSKAVLYFDCENSIPKAIVFNPLDKVSFGNSIYAIEKLEEKKAFDKIVYYKLYLKKEGV